MPEKPAMQEDRSAVPAKDEAAAPQPATPPDRDATARDTEKPEDEKRIERFRER
jgi:hypothetical protein